MEHLNLIAQAGQLDPNEALRRAAEFDSLAYVLVLAMLLAATLVGTLGGALLWKVVIPGYKRKQDREDQNVQNQTTFVRALDKQTTLIASIDEKITDGFQHVHKRIDEFWPRRGGDHSPGGNCKPPQ